MTSRASKENSPRRGNRGEARPTAPRKAADVAQPAGGWRERLRTPLGLGLVSAITMFLALPPAGLWPLAWVAPLGWLWLIRRPDLSVASNESTEAPASRWRRFLRFWKRPYPSIWLSGFVFWMATLHWLRLPHWGTSIGWVALCFYFAFYIPVFVGLSRVLVHRWRVSILLAAPTIWMAMEFVRAYMLTGFSMGELGHTQLAWNWLIQIADLGGSFLVSFLVMFVAAALARMLPLDASSKAAAAKFTFWPAIPAVVLVAAALGYGAWRTGQPHVEGSRSLRVGLIQSSFDTEFRHIPDRDKNIMDTYWRLSRQAMSKATDRPVDLIVWPESMFRQPLITSDPGATAPPESGMQPGELELAPERFREDLESVRQNLDVEAMLVGMSRTNVGQDQLQKYNSAAFLKRRTEAIHAPFKLPLPADDPQLVVYDKMHAVPFGEFIPFARYFPWLYDVTPLPGGIEEGTEPKFLDVEGVTFSPSICFESIQSHHIRDAVVRLQDTAGDPDLLINVTNDGWFWGSSELDLHLICGAFRAIECRKPFLVAANTGISAVIDGNGVVLERGPKRGDAVIVRDVSPDPRGSFYLRTGPWIAWICLVVAIAAAGTGWRDRRTRRQKPVA